MPDNERERWNGQLIDANGRQASIEVHFIREKKIAAWKLQISERDGTPTELEGEAAWENQSLKEPIRLESSEKVGDKGSVDWTLTLEPADAAMYANGALVGQYSLKTEGIDLELPMSRGVLVLWQFA